MLSRNKVRQIISDWRTDMGNSVKFTDQDATMVENMYFEEMTQNVNKNRTPLEQESMITANCIDIASGMDYKSAFTVFSDNKHLVYLDNFLYGGATQDVIKALTKNKMTSNVLQGIVFEEPIEVSGDIDGYRYDIRGIIYKYISEEEEEDKKSWLQIYKNGKLIYDSVQFDYDYDIFPEDDVYLKSIMNTKNMTRKNKIIDIYRNDNMQIVLVSKDKNGKTIYSGLNGRRIAK